MEKVKTPSDYILFLKSEEGSKLLEKLKSAREFVKPFKRNAWMSLIAGVIVAGIVLKLTGSFWGLIFILPSFYFFYILGQNGHVLDEAQRNFNEGINQYYFGKDYRSKSCNVDFIPMGFMRGLPNFSGLWKESYIDLGDFGQARKLRITRTYTEIKDDKEEKTEKNTYEQANLIVLPENSLVKNKKATFYLKREKFVLLEAMGVGLKGNRDFTLTDTELAQWYEVSVGGLGDVLRENQAEKFDWTKIITPFFENVLKALVIKYGEIHFVIEDGYFFAFVAKKELPYKSAEFGRLDRKHYYKNTWLSNESAELKDGKSSPESALPYIYKLYLNRIMKAMTSYFFMNHADVSQEELEESREILDYVVNQYNHVDVESMNEEYKAL